MVLHVAHDNFGRQMWIDLFGIHKTTSLSFRELSYTEIKSALKMGREHFG
jgi:hypothetical protein